MLIPPSSNGGVFGSLYGTPIINLPQSAVLGAFSAPASPRIHPSWIRTTLSHFPSPSTLSPARVPGDRSASCSPIPHGSELLTSTLCTRHVRDQGPASRRQRPDRYSPDHGRRAHLRPSPARRPGGRHLPRYVPFSLFSLPPRSSLTGTWMGDCSQGQGVPRGPEENAPRRINAHDGRRRRGRRRGAGRGDGGPQGPGGQRCGAGAGVSRAVRNVYLVSIPLLPQCPPLRPASAAASVSRRGCSRPTQRRL